MHELTYKYYHKAGGALAYVVLHGGGPEGIETPFISSVFDALAATGTSVYGFNFPYCERGEESSSGPDLPEETAALEKVIDFLRHEGYEKIVIVAKSLGGIVTSYWLTEHPEANVSVAILGYVIGSVKTEALQGKLQLVIQGELDRFGGAEAVRNELAAHGVSAEVTEIPQADHSYRNEQKQPVHQPAAVQTLIAKLQR